MVDRSFGSMVFEDQGEGPPVVMVHGLGGTSNSFQTLVPYLDEFRIVRLDLPGAGRSGYRPGKPGMAGMVDALTNALKLVDIERAHFVGHSMGTLLCQYLAVKHTDLVASMTLFGALFEPTPAARDGLRERAKKARENGMTDIAEAVSSASTADSSKRRNPVIKAFVRESLMRQNLTGYAAHCEALSEASAADHKKIECSTLLITGEHDGVAPVAMGRELAARIRQARLEVIPDVGHWLMIEAPERSAELMCDHLNSLIAQVN